MDIAFRLLSLAIGYGFGSLLTAELVTRVRTGHSARSIGTGNPGMANIMKQLGKPAGFAVLAGDTLKTLAACGVCGAVLGPHIGREAVLWAGFGAVLGHDFPAWRGFRGGKGVTVTCVWLMVALPGWGLLSCLVGGAVTLITGYLPLGAVVIPALATPFAFVSLGTEGGLVVLAGAVLMLGCHHRGLLRVVRGQEHRAFRRR